MTRAGVEKEVLRIKVGIIIPQLLALVHVFWEVLVFGPLTGNVIWRRFGGQPERNTRGWLSMKQCGSVTICGGRANCPREGMLVISVDYWYPREHNLGLGGGLSFAHAIS